VNSPKSTLHLARISQFVRRRLAVAVTGLIIVAMFLATGWSHTQSHHSDLVAGSAEAHYVAYLLAQRTSQLLSRVDHVMNLAVNRPILPPARDLVVGGATVILVDDKGKVTDSTVFKQGDNLSRARFFAIAQAAGSSQLQLAPLTRFGTGAPETLPVVRALYNERGQFAGAIVVALRASFLTDVLYMAKHPHALFALADGKGQLLSGAIDRQQVPLVRLNSAQWGPLRLPVKKGMPLPALVSSFDRVPRMTAVKPVAQYGLHAMVGVPVASATADAEALFAKVYVIVSILGLGILVASVGFQRQNRQLRDALDTRSSAEDALREEKEFLDVTLGSIEDAVITLDQHQRITFMNRRAEVLTRWSAADAMGRPVHDVVRLKADAGEEGKGSYVSLTAESTRAQGAAKLESPFGAVEVEYVMRPLAQRHSNTHSVLVLHDVSKAMEMSHKLAYQATHDPLTGLFNRAAFDNKLDSVLEVLEHERSMHVLLFLDLDQFKVVNDSCGHAAGDELLKQVAFLFGQALRPQDILARTGGDEFAVLLQNCPARVALTVADKLRDQLTSFRFVWKEKSFQVGVSIGAVAIAPGCGSRDELMRKADTACYIAKDGGRNRAHLYLDSDEAVMAKQGELSWATRLQKALTTGGFQLQGQRIATPKNGKGGHYFELLIRLEDDDGRLVPPMAFLPAAERYGLMPALDRAVIERAMTMHGTLQAATPQPVKFAINLSGASLSDPQLLEFVEGMLRKHQVPASNICFEVTETMAIANLGVAVKLMTGLKVLGCGLALDDFGSGMSSFTYLKQLPVDVVKIDGSFVRSMLVNPVDRAMVEAVNNIAHQMGLQTLAEYAESPELIDALCGMGVDMLQGYGVGKPKSLAEMLQCVTSDGVKNP